MDTSMLMRRLTFAYASTALILFVLILSSQGLIQYTLYRGVVTRDLASAMALQELRTQAIFRNGLLALLPTGEQTAMNALGVKPVDAMTKNLVDVEATNKMLLGVNSPVDVAGQMQPLQSDFVQMDQAGHAVLADLKAGNTKDAGNQLGTLFVHEQKYLVGTYNAYVSLTADADDYVSSVRVLELVICAISLLVLAIEALFVIRPVLVDYTKIKQAEQQQKKEETV